MKSFTLPYEGHTNIYLQGDDALEPVDISVRFMSYFVASPESKIFVRDHRSLPALEAKKALSGDDKENFVDAFCQPASVKIQAKDRRVEIEINEGHATKQEDLLTLWLGVIDNGKMAVHKTHWEQLQPLGNKRFAFAALVE